MKPLLKIFNECRSSMGVGELNPYWRSSINVKLNGGGTFIFPNAFVDLPKTRRVWAKRGVCAYLYSTSTRPLRRCQLNTMSFGLVRIKPSVTRSFLHETSFEYANREIYVLLIITSSTAQGGGVSFKNRKPIGEVGCCDSQMAERTHWWTDRWLELCFLERLQWMQRSPHHNCWM